jgi:hypothetical protein
MSQLFLCVILSLVSLVLARVFKQDHWYWLAVWYSVQAVMEMGA